MSGAPVVAAGEVRENGQTVVVPDTRAQQERLQHAIAAVDADLLARYPIDTYIQHLDARPRYAAYHFVSDATLEMCNAIAAGGREPLLEQYHQLVFMTLIARFRERIRGRILPLSIAEQYSLALQRIVDSLDTNAPGFYLYPNENFCKDVAICSQRMIPAGMRLIQEYSGVPRSLLWRHGPRQFFKGLWYFTFETRGFRTICEPHSDSRDFSEFTPEGLTRFCLRLAEFFELNPHVKGWFGDSWFYDPYVAVISPRLWYIRQIPEEGGAQFFYSGPGEEANRNALATSPTRQRLHAEGSYTPISYLMVWSRSALLRWAKRQ